MCINLINLCSLIICIHSNVAKVRCLDHGGKQDYDISICLKTFIKGVLKGQHGGRGCCNIVPLKISIFCDLLLCSQQMQLDAAIY